ncbi:uncharacterized protein [Panulirus ornatus]|uniref:uncharacterized protein isoform X2 n=1 Tax=Panulirus ornatus TaxID=150431 RepID=UPI003A8AFE7E
METTRVLTSLLVLTLTGPTLGYPYTRGVPARASGRGRDQMLDYSLGDYLGGYSEQEPQQYGVPEYEPPSPRYTYAAQQPRINAEVLAALLPYLTAASDDYDYDYNTYNDEDGTWYDDTANDADADNVNNQDAALLQLLLNHRAGSSSPVRYSLEDLENLEREAEMEDNTENQLHALMEKKINKKSSMPVLGGRLAVGTRLLRKGQKEEAYDIPATSVRRPVFARTITTEPEDQGEPQSISNNNGSSHKPQVVKRESTGSSSVVDVSNTDSSSSSSSSSAGSEATAETVTMTPYMQDRYEALKKYLDRERKVRQQDMEMELQEQRRSAPQKRFVAEQESLTQQLANLKKSMA